MTEDIKRRIEKILRNAPLVISRTRRAGSNGLRNADEIADKIVKELTAREEANCDICGDYHEGNVPLSCQTGDGV